MSKYRMENNDMERYPYHEQEQDALLDAACNE